MLDDGARAGPAARRSCIGDALALPFPNDSFDRVFTRPLLRPPRGARAAPLPRRGPPRRARAGRRRRLARARRDRTSAWQQRVLDDGSTLAGLQARASTGSRARGRARRRRGAARGPLVRGRPLDAVTLSLARGAEARPVGVPRLRRGGYPLESLPVIAPGSRAARLPLRAGARGRRGRGAPAVARPRRQDAAPLARPRRGRVLRDVLLRVGDPLLPGRAGVRPRRPHADAERSSASASAGATRSSAC